VGVEHKSPDNVPVTTRTDQDERIRTLYVDRRYSDREIAEALGIHRVTVTKRRLALGITRADRRPAA
jgi:DNA-binding transcriptional regulator LsrR (DeoR family)